MRRTIPGLLSVVLLIILPATASPTYAAADPLDGRLGGTYASLIDRFGEPLRLVDALGLVFAYPDTRYLAVQFANTEGSYDPGDPALIISVSADRAETRPADEPDPADWSWETAQAIAADLAPADAAFGEADDSVAGVRSATCESAALREHFGESGPGGCRVTYVASSEDTVGFLTLTLADGPVGDGPATAEADAACDGVVAWAGTAGDRLDAAQAALGPLATLSDDPAVAVPALRGMADELDALADEQRSGVAPSEAATANYYIIGALADFSAAVALAADGLEAGDQATVDDAIADLDDADRRAADASDAIVALVADCDLTTGTPAAD